LCRGGQCEAAVRADRYRSVILIAVRNDARLRFAGLLAAGSLAVHQIRYAVGYGSESSRALTDQGHGYLGVAGTLAAVLLAVALGAFLGSLLRGRSAATRQPGFRPLWIAAAGALAATYTGQEMIEGALAHGHPGGLEAVLGHGGWIAFAAAGAIGALVALAMRGAHAALSPASPGRTLSVGRPSSPPLLRVAAQIARPTAAFAAAGPARGPPAAPC
jgi:hypothetical protein